MKRDWARLLTVGGAIVIMQSIFWEYARMKPDNNYLVTPWSARGLDSVHGTVFFVIGAALLVAGLVVASKWTQDPRNSLITVGGIIVGAVIITLVFAGDEEATLGGGLSGAVIGLGLGYLIFLALKRYTASNGGPDSTAAQVLSGGTGALSMFALLGIGIFLSNLILGEGRELAAPVAILFIMVLLGGLMALGKETSMAANRMLIATSVVAGTAIGLSGAAIRSTLVRLQAEGGNIPGEYRDTQVTWGYFLANIGVVLFFMGAVMLWARRRDVVQAQARAAKQRAAAEESAAELAAAG